MHIVITRFSDSSSILNNIKLSEFKKFLKSNNYKKPYIPLIKYLVQFIFYKASYMDKCNKDIVNFEIR